MLVKMLHPHPITSRIACQDVKGDVIICNIMLLLAHHSPTLAAAVAFVLDAEAVPVHDGLHPSLAVGTIVVILCLTFANEEALRGAIEHVDPEGVIGQFRGETRVLTDTCPPGSRAM
jgi:hypothetical protein